jgi:hypothetical protein
MKDRPDATTSQFHERAQEALEEFRRTGTSHSASEVVSRLQEKLDVSREFLALRAILGDEILGSLVGVPSVSPGSVEGPPPAPARRIMLIGQIVWCLKGAYDDEGIKRWFCRRRPQLQGKSPAEHLGDDWQADSPAATRALALAANLAGTNCPHSLSGEP